MALGARFPHSPREERFEFTPENRAELGRIMAKYPARRSALIPALQLAQKQAGAVTSAVMQHLAAIFGISPMDVWGVVSFYSMLKTRPVGKHHVMVCDNLSCALLGAGSLLRHLEQRLGCRAGHTRADGKFSIERVECLGACGGAPCLQINEDYFERVTPAMADEIVAALEKGEPVAPVGADEAAPPRDGAGAAQESAAQESAAQESAAQEKAAG